MQEEEEEDGHPDFSQTPATMSPECSGNDGDPSNQESTNSLCVIPESAGPVDLEGVVSGTSEGCVATYSSSPEGEEFGADKEDVVISSPSEEEEEGMLKASFSEPTFEQELSALDPFISGDQNNLEHLGEASSLDEYVDPSPHVASLDHVESSGNSDLSRHIVMSSSPSTDVTRDDEALHQPNAADSGLSHTEEWVEPPAGISVQDDVTEVGVGMSCPLDSVLYTNS